jgi:hypothetical protein
MSASVVTLAPLVVGVGLLLIAYVASASSIIQPRPGLSPVEDRLWYTGHEAGDISDWDAGACGGKFDDAPAGSTIAGVAKNGRYGLAMRVPNLNTGSSLGTRLFRWCEAQQHDALYYSAWYFIPQQVTVNYWWGIMEWKSPGSFNHKFMLIVRNRPTGQMYLTLERGMDSGGGAWSQSVKNLPVGQWVHLETYYKKATNTSGRITVWQDGTQILDVGNVATSNSNDLRWAVINYGQDTRRSNLRIFVDDVAISTRRLGP